ncbi:HAD family hydrolase [Blastococcus sp. CCUG 61487]|uniref:HAD family hydrolase n=1 Tax=Blastococcus sp. CCUG 61487 TaxID=1840703 RepID=UPI0010C03FE9|nr:HAD family hydrolase [Blastococcus sp. CCUG 61487]TKJ23429.1 haloacid dehalogenase [Blastococcus sp. CCUG 61487]
MTARPPRAIRPHGILPGADRVVDLGKLDPWRPKLVASDLDGTLLDEHGRVSARTREALDACWAAGIPVVGVTGRGPRLLETVHDALGGRGIAVLSQGGFVVDLEREEVLRTVAMPREHAVRVIEAIEGVAGDVTIAVEDAAEQGEVRTRLRVENGFDWPYPELSHVLERGEVMPEGAVLKVFLRSDTLDQDQLLAHARAVVDPADAEVTHAGLGFIEVLPPGITKASGLQMALDRYGVGFGDVLVFGDMPNDLPMLAAVQDAGGRAVAVANAHPEVRALTPHLTSGHRADGVARYLEAVLPGV